MCLQSKGWDGTYVLVRKATGVAVCNGDMLDDGVALTHGEAPHKPSSSGFIHVLMIPDNRTSRYYASVYDLEWRKLES